MSPIISPYGTLSGQLFLYAGCRAAFESPIFIHTTISSSSAPSSQQHQHQQSESTSTTNLTTKKCILLGGLSDGLLPCPYTAELEFACHQNNWSLVQPLLSSSYTGFGHGSLQRDTDEINELLEYLVEHRNAKQFCIVGHSTGCQNIVHYLKYGNTNVVDLVESVVLQAPVSDREHSAMTDDYEKYLSIAQQMKFDGRLNECMPRDAFWAPITASRYLDLNEKGGLDDYFSSDYTNDELTERLHHMTTRTTTGQSQSNSRNVVVVYSGSDEYVPDSIDSKLLTDRLVKAMNNNNNGNGNNDSAKSLYLPTANHNLSNDDDARKTFVSAVEELLLR